MGREAGYNVKLLKTAILVLTLVARGFENSLVGTTMPDLRTRFGTDAAGISYALSVGAMGGMIGSLMAPLLDRFGNYYDLLLGCLVGLMSVVTALRTCSTWLWLFTLCDVIDEFCWGLLSPGGESMIMGLWGSGASPYLQTMQLGYPLGATLGPLVAGLFVSHNSTAVYENTTNSASSMYEENPVYDTMIVKYMLEEDRHAQASASSTQEDDRFPDDSNIQYVYYIGSCLLLITSAAFFLSYFCINIDNVKYVRKTTFQWGEICSASKWTEGEKWLGVGMLTLMIIFFIAFNNQWGVISLFISTYAVDSGLGFTNQQAAILNSVLNFSGALGRFSAIFISNFIAAKYLFMFHTNAAGVLSVLLAIFGPMSKTNLYVFTALFGFVDRPIRGYTYAFMNAYMLMISTIFGLMRFSSSFATIFLQAMHGYLYDATVIDVIFYLSVVYAVVFVIAQLLMIFLGRYYGTLESRREQGNACKNYNNNLDHPENMTAQSGENESHLKPVYSVSLHLNELLGHTKAENNECTSL